MEPKKDKKDDKDRVMKAIEEIHKYLQDNGITADDLNKISESVQDRLFEEMYGKGK